MTAPTTATPTPLETAIVWARSLHDGATHGHRPFIQHVVEVVGVLKRFGADTPDLLVAAWLHDVVEDTDMTLDRIEAQFGPRIALLVDAVTDVEKSEDYPNRKTRKTATLRKTAAVPGARIVKLADRIANVEYSWADGNDKFMAMYAKEHEEFAAALYVRGTTGPQLRMQQYLDHLLLP